ncbi:MAG: hypothetical protein A2293_15890 [Elusimicrobia bacterium RIFOXYB2_FULL_49_7]|nr:MAG: hypothetical protein A2293_15890 [Elusimicrobia bacterium RIFOXYB2_FULL_49_7]
MILYLGDTSLQKAAAYLAGVMAHSKIAFDYLPSDKTFQDRFLKKDYKAIILSDYPANNFTPSQVKGVLSCVRNGMGLLMIGGWESFTGLNAGYEKNALTQALPVTLSNKDDRVNTASPCVVIKETEHPLLKGLPLSDHLPCVSGFNRLKAKPGCPILLSICQLSVKSVKEKLHFIEKEKAPLLTLGQFGLGKTAAYASDAAPHWSGGFVDWGTKRIAAQAPGAEEVEIGNAYVEFFTRLIRFVSK